MQKKLESIDSEEFGEPGLRQFSGIIPASIIPTEILEKSENAEQEDYFFDEFGFRVESDCEHQISPTAAGKHDTAAIDESSRLKWIALLEFNSNSNGDLNFEHTIPKTEKVRNMILREGIPHSLRPHVWMCLSGAYEKKRKSQSSYMDIVKVSNNDSLVTSKQIEKDLTRILPSNICFTSMNGTGIPRLRRILRALAWLFPSVGYCQGTGVSTSIVSQAVALLSSNFRSSSVLCCCCSKKKTASG